MISFCKKVGLVGQEREGDRQRVTSKSEKFGVIKGRDEWVVEDEREIEKGKVSKRVGEGIGRGGREKGG